MGARPRSLVFGVAVLAVVVLAIWLVTADGDDGPTPTSTSSSSTTSTTTTTSTSTTAPAPTSTTAGGPSRVIGPGPVTVLEARPGGGSGEIEFDWTAVADASGYRVLRADSASGPFSEAAEIDITAGEATAAGDVVNLWSEQHSYVPASGTLAAPDTSDRFQYVEAGGAQHRCFRVVAIGPSGDGPASEVRCGSPP